jgi:hypothetical protein
MNSVACVGVSGGVFEQVEQHDIVREGRKISVHTLTEEAEGESALGDYLTCKLSGNFHL